MAKSARSSIIKRNKAKLRASVFGPVVDRRTERLSAKLQELASKTSVKDADMTDADFTLTGMDIDQTPSSSKSKSAEESNTANRIQKKVRRKTRPSITFKPHPRKAKKATTKKR
ncbi:predicted protein [Uncinocarpus reesii 1704]|uniref:DUF2423 domain-containing protein n=1 Tax=Uncinocarpus reesii (strain UAMH 1704) TaxID=336963 RepID=C4JPJ0_UNCRE|nr:uncharacterized protein UREG_03162 [Uncinocarpus reesii 1704]EEP78316.1 predicted protein [Uncinocarpus reesii 1704]